MLDRLIQLRAHGTTVRTERLAGLTTFLTMAYIVFVSPEIPAAAGIPCDAVFVATCPAAAIVGLPELDGSRLLREAGLGVFSIGQFEGE